MQKKLIVLIGYVLSAIILFIIFKQPFLSYFSVVLILGFVLLIDTLYYLSGKKKRVLLLSLSIVSFLLLLGYMLFGIHEEPATSVGDMNLLPVLLFIVSVPFFIITHVAIISSLFTKIK